MNLLICVGPYRLVIKKRRIYKQRPIKRRIIFFKELIYFLHNGLFVATRACGIVTFLSNLTELYLIFFGYILKYLKMYDLRIN